MTAKIPASTKNYIFSHIFLTIIIMPHEFCTRLRAKIRRLGYAPHRADCILMFLVRSMTVVCAVMDVLNVPERALWEPGRRSKSPAAAPLTVFPAAYGIHSLPPA